MGLVKMSKVVVEADPAAKEKIVRKLLELGAESLDVGQRKLTAAATGGGNTSGTEVVVVEALLHTNEVNRAIHSLGDVCGDANALTISLSNVFVREQTNKLRRPNSAFRLREQDWVDCLITI